MKEILIKRIKMKNSKNKPSKGFWSLYVICLFILISIGFKFEFELLYFILLPFTTFLMEYIIIIIHYIVAMIIEDI